MLCRERSLVKEDAQGGIAIPLMCRSWGCEFCRPMRHRQLVALAESGQPNRFVTLTAAAASGKSREQRAARLAAAWRLVVKRWRRANPGKTLEYLAVFEATKNGEPHLHILCRSAWIGQRWLSKQMQALTASPIVDIRVVRPGSGYSRYVTKYVGKDPHRFAQCKRYWYSPGYPRRDEPDKPGDAFGPSFWRVQDLSVAQVARQWRRQGHVVSERRINNPNAPGDLAINEAEWRADDPNDRMNKAAEKKRMKQLRPHPPPYLGPLWEPHPLRVSHIG
jgi:hypothetical protein